MRFQRFANLLISLAFLVAGSCDEKPDTSLDIVTNESVIVVPGSAPNCSDVRGGTSPIPQSLTADFFKLSVLHLNWNGGSTGAKVLAVAALKISFDHPFIDGSPVEKYISGTDLTYALNGTENDTRYDPGTIDMNSGNPNGVFKAAHTCGIGLGGLKRVAGHENVKFSTMATLEFIGYAENSDGSDQEPVRASTHVRLNFF